MQKGTDGRVIPITFISGQIVDNWKILRKDENSIKTNKYICECQGCFNEYSVRASSIGKDSKICRPCAVRKTVNEQKSKIEFIDYKWLDKPYQVSEYKTWDIIGELNYQYFRSKLQSALEKNLNFNLNPIKIYDLFLTQDKKCAISNIEIKLDPKYHKSNYKNQTASLDRINSSYGYENDNVQWVHKDVNKLKSNFSDYDLIYWSTLIANPKKNQSNNKSIISNSYWKSLIKSCENRLIRFKNSKNNEKYIFNISKEEAQEQLEKQNYICNITGLPIYLEKHYSGKYKKQTGSLDRIDSNLGYINGNIQWLHKTVNCLKNNFSQDYFIKLCTLIANHNNPFNQLFI